MINFTGNWELGEKENGDTKQQANGEGARTGGVAETGDNTNQSFVPLLERSTGHDYV